MRKKIIGLSLMILSLSIMSCEKDDDTTKKENDLIIGQWKLSGLVNISNEQKYLNSILEISNSKEYTNSEETGESIVNGTWTKLEGSEKVELSSGIFEDYSVDYNLIKNDNDSLILERHYTLGGKDTYLEYHYKRIE